ncbi:MAG: GNAT family N-acetyltransferase [Caldilineaceae bacterium]|nr:GNAT family N-acetyltransferase [Caldilineaceae bacterium]
MSAQLARGQREKIRALLEQDCAWAAYALADLQPQMDQYCAWSLAADGRGLALIYTGLPTPTLFTFGPPASVADAVAQIDLPRRIYITVREEHFPVASAYYDFSADQRPMDRMVLPASAAMAAPNLPVTELSGGCGDRLRRLYAHGGAFAPDAFDSAQLDGGAFFGVTDEKGDLIAAGGTHIVDWDAGVAAIGNMYTRPDERGRGYAAAVLQAIVRKLRAGGIRDIVLNVDQRNAGAQRLYARHGFLRHCPYTEGIGEKQE